MDIKLLREIMYDKHMSVQSLADAIGVDDKTLYRHLANPEKMSLTEIKAICDALKLSKNKRIQIFFSWLLS